MHRALLVPLLIVNAEASDYVNGVSNVSGCYLLFRGLNCRDCMYSWALYYAADCVDCVMCVHCELCFACHDLERCYDCQHCNDCRSCASCIACFGCRGCSDCIGCVGLEKAQHCLFNEQLSPEAFFERKAALNLGSHIAREALLQEFARFRAEDGYEPVTIISSEECTGAYIEHSKKLTDCFYAEESLDCGYVTKCLKSVDCWKGSATESELCCSCVPTRSQNIAFTVPSRACESVFYSFMMINCSHCFGCSSLRGKSYCILNKQYSKSEYFEMLPRIAAHMESTEEWGEFFPAQLSPHCYNESEAINFVEDLSDSELLRRGYRIREAAESHPDVSAVGAADLPGSIEDLNADVWAGKNVRCEATGRLFNLQKRELEYYKRNRIPLPRKHWSERIGGMLRRRKRMPEDSAVVAEQVEPSASRPVYS